ncbi:hypothetical protein [Vibrio nigripulchritudo]|uniref:hypothetical protein n=1 Tax=Vibrio nigripulchritudo TaxID=28173 RepID=UPI0003B18612|nr:hypothetical protein [Vibrio nigripulchritudo]CCN70544.1 hypothetical protein VIBNISFn118_2250001 [Vibrio nigripulchritudo SFn118]
MSTSDFVTWLGTGVTLLGTGVTLWQARKVKKYRDQVAFDLRKISIAEAGEALRRALEDCRKLLTSTASNRGQSNANICNSIQERIDIATDRFNQKDFDNDIKEKLKQATQTLHTVRGSTTTSNSVNQLHTSIQEAVVLCNERISEIR